MEKKNALTFKARATIHRRYYAQLYSQLRNWLFAFTCCTPQQVHKRGGGGIIYKSSRSVQRCAPRLDAHLQKVLQMHSRLARGEEDGGKREREGGWESRAYISPKFLDVLTGSFFKLLHLARIATREVFGQKFTMYKATNPFLPAFSLSPLPQHTHIHTANRSFGATPSL